ncbi:MAG: helix-turn-helix transcriptional regulator [Pseudomonadales bacterium]|nr:helix-turn-helix transcriptional regulator [Pseudomonadales bacterium]
MSNKNDNKFGLQLRAFRKARGMTLAQLAAASNISTANLSKAENGKISPTYDVLEKLARGLDISFSDLVSEQGPASQAVASPAAGRISVNRGDFATTISTDQYDYTYLSADLKSKKMVPIIMRMKANAIESFGDLISHGGEEFLFVLRGIVDVHTEHYETIRLKKGESMYLDSSMGHAFIAAGKSDAEILTVATEPVDMTSGPLRGGK